MRKRIFEIIERARVGDRASDIYDAFMMVTIFMSIVPLAFKESTAVFDVIEIFSVSVFVADYILRLITADYKLNEHSFAAFVKYPFTFWALVDLFAVLPSLTVLNSGFKLLKVFRLAKTFKVIRIFKAARYSKSIEVVLNVIKKSKDALAAVASLAVVYILISALVIFNVEPDSFNTYFDAVYWATISLTTVGYGDIYPVTTVGRMVTMVSSLMGVAVIALAAGVITAGYQQVIREQKE